MAAHHLILAALATIALTVPGPEPRAGSSHATAFVDVNVLTMDDERTVAHQTVIVEGNRITALGPARSVTIPADAVRVEGRGSAYLLPGLADMHVHVQTEEDLALFTASGVTTVLHMGDAPKWMVGSANADVDSGKLVGPHVYFAMLLDSGAPQHICVSTPVEARAAVALARTNGYDFIKVYNGLTKAEFATIVAEAKRRGIAVIGHGVRAVGLPAGLFRGQVMVAHAEEFYYTAFHDREERLRIAEVVAATRRSGAYVTPNLSLFEAIARQWGKPEVVGTFLADPRAASISPGTRVFWLEHNPYSARTGSLDGMLAFLREFTKALSDAGVPLLAGTDTPLPGMFPGDSLHDDLAALVSAELTPYQAIVAATRAPGDFIARHGPGGVPFGRVRVGYKADLVLASANPLAELATLRKPVGVMSAGRWRSAGELDAIVAERRALYQKILK